MQYFYCISSISYLKILRKLNAQYFNKFITANLIFTFTFTYENNNLIYSFNCLFQLYIKSKI